MSSLQMYLTDNTYQSNTYTEKGNTYTKEESGTTSIKASNLVQYNTDSNHQPWTLPHISYMTLKNYITPLNLDFLMKLVISHRIVVSM